MNKCKHFKNIKKVEPQNEGCVDCCDQSKNKHITKHFKATKHPLVKSFEPGEEWIWCYVDKLLFE